MRVPMGKGPSIQILHVFLRLALLLSSLVTSTAFPVPWSCECSTNVHACKQAVWLGVLVAFQLWPFPLLQPHGAQSNLA